MDPFRQGACDFRSGQAFDQIVFFDEAVDIHHIFPKAVLKNAYQSREADDIARGAQFCRISSVVMDRQRRFSDRQIAACDNQSLRIDAT